MEWLVESSHETGSFSLQFVFKTDRIQIQYFAAFINLCDHPIPSSSHGPSAPLHQSSGGSVKNVPTQKEGGTPIEPQQVEHNNYPGGMKPRFLLVLWSGKFDSLAWSNHRPKRPPIRCFARIHHVNVVKPIILDLPLWQFYEQNHQFSWIYHNDAG